MKYKCKCPPDSPFHWRDNPRPSIFSQDNGALLSMRQTAVVERERENGHDVSHVAGLSKRPENLRRPTITVKQFTVFSRAGQVL
jgi:hypothetical protein